jgi:hypothetical protein
MYGIILDFYWFGGEAPVTVTMEAATKEELLAVAEVDPTVDQGNWPRAEVVPLKCPSIKRLSQISPLALLA